MKYIFLHGMGQNASSWDKTISFLPDNIETVCLELSDFLQKETAITIKYILLFVITVINFLIH